MPSLYSGELKGIQYGDQKRKELMAYEAARDQAQQQAQAQGLAAQAQVMQAQQARETALEPGRQARTAEMLGQGLAATPQQAPVAPPKKVMELADFVSNVARGNTRQAEVDSGFVRPGSTRKNADGSLSFVSHEGEEVTLPKAVVDQGIGLRQTAPRSPLEDEYLRERIEATRAGTEAKQKPKEMTGTEKAKAAEALTNWKQAQQEVDGLSKGFFESEAKFAARKKKAQEMADAYRSAYDIFGVTEGRPMNTTPVNPNAPAQSPMARKEFASPAEAEKAGLPKGTEVVIGGRRAIIE